MKIKKHVDAGRVSATNNETLAHALKTRGVNVETNVSDEWIDEVRLRLRAGLNLKDAVAEFLAAHEEWR